MKYRYAEMKKFMDFAQKWKKRHPDVSVPLSEIDYWSEIYRRYNPITPFGHNGHSGQVNPSPAAEIYPPINIREYKTIIVASARY